MKRFYSDRNKQHFLQLISDLDWNKIYNSCDSQQTFSLYHQIFTKHYGKCFPKKEIKTKYDNRKPWLSEGLKQSIKIKNKLYKKSIKIKSSYNEMKYKMYKNKINQLLLKAEKKYYSDILNTNSLQATIAHHGPSMYSGHYTASINCCKRTFYCNDSKITEFETIDTKNSSTAYVAMYMYELIT